jgi:hypothetical protein
MEKNLKKEVSKPSRFLNLVELVAQFISLPSLPRAAQLGPVGPARTPLVVTSRSPAP